jgi:long-chain acyl-CoA synthetase
LRETLRLEPGARVAIQIPNELAYTIGEFGTFIAGCVLINVNPLYTAHEMAHVLAVSLSIQGLVNDGLFAEKCIRRCAAESQ